MDWIFVGKTAVKLVAASSVNSVLKEATKTLIPIEATVFKKVTMKVGLFVLASWITNEAANHAVQELDAFLVIREPEIVLDKDEE